jgi:uncharacterized repeat protein (TIGR04138 family)
MKKPQFSDALSEIVAADPRYAEEAYLFVREALDFTIKMLNKPKEGPARHVRGEELLDGLRQYALQEFGPLARTVLNAWGIHRCVDFGHMVFNLVQHGVLGKTDEDRLEDFAGGYDFDEAFRKPFRPRSHSAAGTPAATE